MPANLPAPPAKGKSRKSSSVAVAERRIKGAVPAVAVKMFWAEVASEVPVAAPKTGVTKVGEVEKTKFVLVVPVVPAAVNPVMLLKQVMEAEEQFVPPLATGNTPVTPVVSGRPVALVKTPEAGVPKAGVTRVGEVAKTKAPLPVSVETEVIRLEEVMESVAVP